MEHDAFRIPCDRPSTAQQDVRSQRLAILEYARAHDFRIDDFIEATSSGQAPQEASAARRADERPPARRPPSRQRTLAALFAEVERDLISEHTREGLARRARSSGLTLGRPKGSLDVFTARRHGGRNRAFPQAGRFQERHRQDLGEALIRPGVEVAVAARADGGVTVTGRLRFEVEVES